MIGRYRLVILFEFPVKVGLGWCFATAAPALLRPVATRRPPKQTRENRLTRCRVTPHLSLPSLDVSATIARGDETNRDFRSPEFRSALSLLIFVVNPLSLAWVPSTPRRLATSAMLSRGTESHSCNGTTQGSRDAPPRIGVEVCDRRPVNRRELWTVVGITLAAALIRFLDPGPSELRSRRGGHGHSRPAVESRDPLPVVSRLRAQPTALLPHRLAVVEALRYRGGRVAIPFRALWPTVPAAYLAAREFASRRAARDRGAFVALNPS